MAVHNVGGVAVWTKALFHKFELEKTTKEGHSSGNGEVIPHPTLLSNQSKESLTLCWV